MTQGEKIDKICKIEGINLKEFSTLCDIPYTTMRHYRKNRFNLSVQAINKICNVPRFAQYRNMLFAQDESISEGSPDGLSANDMEFLSLFHKAEAAGRKEEALNFLRYLLEVSKKPKQ